jgi:carbamoylphosphate synthase large subunit
MHTAIKKQREVEALESTAKSVTEVLEIARDLAAALDKHGIRLERIESTLRQLNQPPPKGGR